MPLKGYKQTEEHKRKISEVEKGKIVSEETKKKQSISQIEYFKIHKNPRYGITVSEETKQKMRIHHAGGIKYHTEETKIKISNSEKGKIVSEETRIKLRKRHHSEESKQRMRINHKGGMKIGFKCPEETKQKLRLHHSGGVKYHSEETKQKMRISAIKYITNITGIIISPRIGRYEKQILDELQNKIGFSIKRSFYINGYYLDGYCQELNLAIEVDEEFHYKNGILRLRDIEKQNNIIKSLHCNFIRIKVEDIVKNENIDTNILLNCLNEVNKIE